MCDLPSASLAAREKGPFDRFDRGQRCEGNRKQGFAMGSMDADSSMPTLRPKVDIFPRPLMLRFSGRSRFATRLSLVNYQLQRLQLLVLDLIG